MVIAVCSVAVALWPEQRRVAVCVGSAGPTPLRAPAAEALLAEADPWDGPAARRASPSASARSSGEAARPIDDVRGTAAYRRHAVAVLARRTLGWAWEARAWA